MTDAPSDDPLVLFMPSGKRGRFAKGTNVLDAARQLGVYVESVCGGRATCGRCQIEVQTGSFAKHQIVSSAQNLSAFSPKEARYARVRGLADGRRLSCSTQIMGDLVVDVPQDTTINAQVVRKAATDRVIERNPAVRLCLVDVPEPDMAQPLGDLDRLKLALEQDWGWRDLQVAPHLLPQVQGILRKGNWTVTAAIHHDEAAARPTIIALWPDLKNEAYGVACDIGSTTVALHLVSLLSGGIVASAGVPNPQIRFGEDLMSRVSYVMMNADGREAMTTAVRGAVRDLIGDVTSQAGVDRHDILDMVFVANPIMHHLFLGIDPTELGQAPFALAVSGPLRIAAMGLDLDVNPGAQTYLLPCIAGHVGADAAGATLAEAPYDQDSMMLLVDIGTNAEIVLGNRDRLVAASSPTGPALEGAEISCGQRAAPGAIERIRIDPQTYEPRFRIIGVDLWSDEAGFAEQAAKFGITGLCGSAIIEIVVELFLAGLMTKDGVIDGAMAARTPRIVAQGRTFSYLIHDGEPRLTITQRDIRAIQLAKAALYAGAKLLMGKLGITHVDMIRLAGGFGAYTDPKYAMILGLIPDCDLAQVKAVGNAAGTGALMALLNRSHRHEIEAQVQRIEKIEPALAPDFQQHFIDAMALPNQTDSFPELSRVVDLPLRETSAASGSAATAGGGRRRRNRPAPPS